MALSVTGSFAATGQSAAITVKGVDDQRGHPINISLWGTFVGTVQVERAFDGGSNWLPLTALGSAIAFTGPVSEVFEEGEAGVQYRLNCTAYTSGTINYRMSW
jgi:hypothetical protein